MGRGGAGAGRGQERRTPLYEGDGEPVAGQRDEHDVDRGEERLAEGGGGSGHKGVKGRTPPGCAGDGLGRTAAHLSHSILQRTAAW